MWLFPLNYQNSHNWSWTFPKCSHLESGNLSSFMFFKTNIIKLQYVWKLRSSSFNFSQAPKMTILQVVQIQSTICSNHHWNAKVAHLHLLKTQKHQVTVMSKPSITKLQLFHGQKSSIAYVFKNPKSPSCSWSFANSSKQQQSNKSRLQIYQISWSQRPKMGGSWRALFGKKGPSRPTHFL